MSEPTYYTRKELEEINWTTCACCEKELNVARMLEQDQRDNTFHDFGDVPENKSQGWFPFGLKCARKEIKKAKEIRGKA